VTRRAIACLVVLGALPASSAGGAGTAATLTVRVLVGGQCGPGADDGGGTRYAPFDAYVRIRNRDTGERRRVRSGEDGRLVRQLPPGRYRVLPGRPADGGPEYSKQRIYIRLAAGEMRRVRLYYDNACR
jgi:hypothetical protein